MSVVTNVLVSGFGGCDPSGCNILIDALNDYLREHELGRLTQIGKHAGGTRAMETILWGGAFNYLCINEFIKIYQDMQPNIRTPIRPQMMMKRQDDNVFYTIPNEDDGREWHYREAAYDRKYRNDCVPG